MQKSLKIQLREIKEDGITIGSTQEIFLDKDANYSQFLTQILSRQTLKHLFVQAYIIYLPQGVQINEDNYRPIVEHLWKIKKQPRLNIQKMTTNKEWNIAEKMKEEAGNYGEKNQEVPYKTQQKKKAMTITFSGSACDKQLKLSESDFPLLEFLNINKTSLNEATMPTISFYNIKEKARAEVMRQLQSP